MSNWLKELFINEVKSISPKNNKKYLHKVIVGPMLCEIFTDNSEPFATESFIAYLTDNGYSISNKYLKCNPYTFVPRITDNKLWFYDTKYANNDSYNNLYPNGQYICVNYAVQEFTLNDDGTYTATTVLKNGSWGVSSDTVIEL